DRVLAVVGVHVCDGRSVGDRARPVTELPVVGDPVAVRIAGARRVEGDVPPFHAEVGPVDLRDRRVVAGARRRERVHSDTVADIQGAVDYGPRRVTDIQG